MKFPEPFYRWRPHPWHGLEAGLDPPRLVRAYIEITPFDLVKYEIDKITGYLVVDRPQRGSSQPPTLYGFIPRTLCGALVAALTPGVKRADGDPLDICVVSERPINHAEMILHAKVVGGLQLIDHGEADDKIIAVMRGDEFYRQWNDVSDCPESYINRLKHYFLTYKHLPSEKSICEITNVYGRDEAHEVIRRSMEDYKSHFGS